MSSRVCQIKISEGIEPHLNHEIKSERDMQSTLKLKSSCDDLMLVIILFLYVSFFKSILLKFVFCFIKSNDDYDGKESSNRTYNNSPNTLAASSTIFRQNSQSNILSPSMSSCYSYSNSCSPTAGVSASNNPNGFQRCFSPSTSLALNNSPSLSSQIGSNQINQNYFSKSPSPTRKLFLSRRSMSPVPCLIRPNSFSAPGSKRKFSDVDSNETNTHASPKRSNNDQEFVQPLLIYTGSTRSIVRSQTSSPFSPLAAMPSSPNPITSLIITAPNTCTKMQTNADEELTHNNPSIQQNTARFSNLPKRKSPLTVDKSLPTEVTSEATKFLWPPVSTKQSRNIISEDTSNKYTFKPIQLPIPSTSTSSFQPSTSSNKNQVNNMSF